MSWSQDLKEYTFYLKLEKKLADNTVEAYLRDLKQAIQYLNGECSIRSGERVRAHHIEQLLARRYDEGISKSSQARLLSGLKSFFTFLLINDRIESLPTEFIVSPKIGRKLPEVLTLDEVERLIESIDLSTPLGHRNKAMLETLYSCGLRVSELISLRLSNLFFEDGYIRVVGKGDKERLVPIGQEAIHLITLYLAERNHQKVEAAHAETLFLNSHGRGLTRVMIFHLIREAAQRSGIHKKISPHTLRHSFATHLLEGGASIRQVQEMLGHESILTTEIYTHLNAKQLQKSLDQHHPLGE